MTKGTIAYGVMPPEQDAAWVACMEDVLATYAAADAPTPPVRWMDEQPVPLLKETRGPSAATAPPGQRVDDEDARHGTARIFLCAAPLAGFRQATARTRRTQADWAIEVAPRLETRYAAWEDVTLVCAHLNTPTTGAFSEAFAPDIARVDLQRITCCSTPQHGSWLQVAACERSCLTSPGMNGRRSGARTALPTDIGAWSAKTNAKQRGVAWQCRIENARVKLKRLYPKIKT